MWREAAVWLVSSSHSTRTTECELDWVSVLRKIRDHFFPGLPGISIPFHGLQPSSSLSLRYKKKWRKMDVIWGVMHHDVTRKWICGLFLRRTDHRVHVSVITLDKEVYEPSSRFLFKYPGHLLSMWTHYRATRTSQNKVDCSSKSPNLCVTK